MRQGLCGWIFTGGRTVHTSLLAFTDKARVWRARVRQVQALASNVLRVQAALWIIGVRLKHKP